MSNLRIKNKKLKRENERLKSLQDKPVVKPVVIERVNTPTTFGASICIDEESVDRMILDGCFEDYIRRRLIDEMEDELVKHIVIEHYRDYCNRMVIISGKLKVVDEKEYRYLGRD